MRTTCTVLQIVPVPGIGAIIAGVKNPHSGLTGRGVAQAALVVFGSWPLIVPGAIGLLWAVWDAVRIHRWSAPPGPWSMPTADAPPETVAPTREQKRAERQARREAKRDARTRRKAQREKEREDDDTRYMP